MPAFIEVNCVAFDPSGSDTQISMLPLRSEQNATLLASAENCGLTSLRVETIARTGEPEMRPGLDSSALQIFTSVETCEYAKWPCREVAG